MTAYDTMTAEQWIYGLLAGLIAFGVMAWLFFRATRPHILSSSDSAPAADARSANQSVDQSAPTSLHGQTSAAAGARLGPAADRATPDMDAENTGLDTPRASSYLTDNEFIVFLATQKLRNGKYRLSANDIVKTVRGDRTEVLAIVRQVREPAPEFPPLTDEQQQQRAQLQLDQR